MPMYRFAVAITARNPRARLVSATGVAVRVSHARVSPDAIPAEGDTRRNPRAIDRESIDSANVINVGEDMSGGSGGKKELDDEIKVRARSS
jgi:hypothetical protein